MMYRSLRRECEVEVSKLEVIDDSSPANVVKNNFGAGGDALTPFEAPMGKLEQDYASKCYRYAQL